MSEYPELQFDYKYSYSIGDDVVFVHDVKELARQTKVDMQIINADKIDYPKPEFKKLHQQRTKLVTRTVAGALAEICHGGTQYFYLLTSSQCAAERVPVHALMSVQEAIELLTSAVE